VSLILLISQPTSIPKALELLLSELQCTWVYRNDPRSVASAVRSGAFEHAVFYLAKGDEPPLEAIAFLRENCSELSIYVIAAENCQPTSEQVIQSGTDLYLAEPVSGRLLQRLLHPPTGTDKPRRESSVARPQMNDFPATVRPPSELQILRDFSRILGFSLDYQAFSGHFILKLREFISFSRIALFLLEPSAQPIIKKEKNARLQCIASLGIPADLINCFQLNREGGLGKAVFAQPRILHERSPALDPAARKELAILDCQIAVPISDRERVIGVAVLNGSVTGRDYSDDELQLLYLLMEELGLAIRNCWLHMELKRHGQLVGNVLGAISSGALVVDDALNILYANPAVYRFLNRAERAHAEIPFADLPARLATRLHRAIEKGERIEPFFMPGVDEQSLYRIAIFPFNDSHDSANGAGAVMVVLEDYTKIEAGKQTALKDSREGIIRTIAERFAHEIRNSLVPLTTHAQLLDSRIGEADFQQSLKHALMSECGRIKRFSEQMLYLASESIALDSSIEIITILQQSFERAQFFCKTPAKLHFHEPLPACKVYGNKQALQEAFEELFINALQGGMDVPVVDVALAPDPGSNMLKISIRDRGCGFNAENLQQVVEPFFTSRNTGVGLGLSVAQRIIRAHHGTLSLASRQEGAEWDIQIELPLCKVTQS
jgi:signal transduction histidine kinase/ActR/RegA family two-component response regulator